jgi:hypothetical protein
MLLVPQMACEKRACPPETHQCNLLSLETALVPLCMQAASEQQAMRVYVDDIALLVSAKKRILQGVMAEHANHAQARAIRNHVHVLLSLSTTYQMQNAMTLILASCRKIGIPVTWNGTNIHDYVPEQVQRSQKWTLAAVIDLQNRRTCHQSGTNYHTAAFVHPGLNLQASAWPVEAGCCVAQLATRRAHGL